MLNHPIRTCSKKHTCRRSIFKDKRERYAATDYKESRYEVWDPAYRGADNDTTDDEVLVFESDDKAECEAFIAQGAQRCFLRENGVCKVCDLYDARKAALAEGRVQPFYVIAYGINRYCYSQAEGGCWADWTTIYLVRRAFTVKEGLRQLRRLKDAFPQPRFNRFSAANRGEDDMVFVLCYAEDDPRWPVETTERATYQ